MDEGTTAGVKVSYDLKHDVGDTSRVTLGPAAIPLKQPSDREGKIPQSFLK